MAIVTENFSAGPSGWTTLRGVNLTRVISDNTGSALSTSNADHRRNFDVGSADMFTECDVVAFGNDEDRSILLHVRNASSGTTRTHYSFLLNRQNNRFSLLRYVNSGAAAIASNVSVTVPAPPFTMRLEVQGSTLRLYVAGTLIRTYSDTSIGSGSMGGVGFFNAGTGATPQTRIDNVRIGALADDVAPPGPEPGRALLAI